MGINPHDWFDVTPLSVSKQVKRVIGHDGQPMLFQGQTGVYLKITSTGLRVLELINGQRTGRDVLVMLQAEVTAMNGDRERAVRRFLEQLLEQAVLSAPVSSDLPSVAKPNRRDAVRRFPLTNRLDLHLKATASLIARVPVWCIAGLAMTALALVGGVLSVGEGLRLPVSWWPLPLLMAAHVGLHEISHALASQLVGHAAREAGVGLLYGFLPVAYVDYADFYGIPSRSARAAIALGGPLSDLLLAGVTAAVLSLNLTPTVTNTARAFLAIQLISLVSHLNPLLPSDGLISLEAITGHYDLRREIWSAVVRRRRLDSALRWGTLLYVTLMCLYLGGLGLFYWWAAR